MSKKCIVCKEEIDSGQVICRPCASEIKMLFELKTAVFELCQDISASDDDISISQRVLDLISDFDLEDQYYEWQA